MPAKGQKSTPNPNSQRTYSLSLAPSQSTGDSPVQTEESAEGTHHRGVGPGSGSGSALWKRISDGAAPSKALRSPHPFPLLISPGGGGEGHSVDCYLQVCLVKVLLSRIRVLMA